MSHDERLKGMLALQSVRTEDMTFGEFLSRLKASPQMADTAAALLVRAIEKRGEVDLKIAPEERVPYLMMLKKMGIPSYVAFDKVKGSQRTVARIMNHLRAAAANGYQLRMALILKGGPGSGKSFLAEALADVLEGEEVFAVEGCPVHENPINLLTLLPAQQLADIARELGMTEEDGSPSLSDLLATAGKPCQHCWSKVFEGQNANEPNLFDIKVEGLRLSSRKFGIATWTGDDLLIETLKRGSRGVVRMPELFSANSKVPLIGGSNAGELEVLLDATNDRRIPASSGKIAIPGFGEIPTSGNACGTHTGWYPFDAVQIGETNDDSFELFVKNTPDSDKFTRRFNTMNVPYILSVTEEELAYRSFVAEMRDQPHFDPMALKLAALLAVISRLKKDHEVDLVTRARMYDGEELVVQKKSTTSSSASGSYGSPLGGFGSYGRPASSSGSGSGKAEPEYWTVGEFWAQAGEDEGMYGLNMADMLGAVSQVVDLSLKDSKHKCVSSVFMMNYLRAKVAAMLKTPGLNSKQREVLKNCEEFLRAPSYRTATPALIEAEYRRVLKRQFMQVVAPDFEKRAAELFEKYRIHAGAFTRNDREAVEPYTTPDGRQTTRRVKIDVEFLDDLDRYMGLTGTTERAEFRRSIEAEIAEEMLKRNQQRSDSDEDSPAEAEALSWRTLPKLAAGITKRLNDEIAKVVERLLQPEFKLSDEDRQLRDRALARFDELGYCEHCRETALQYFKDYELWRQS
jgi:serine protein kinase